MRMRQQQIPNPRTFANANIEGDVRLRLLQNFENNQRSVQYQQQMRRNQQFQQVYRVAH